MATVTFEVGYRDRDGTEGSQFVEVEAGPHAKEQAGKKVEDQGLRTLWCQPWKFTMQEMENLRKKSAARRAQKWVSVDTLSTNEVK